MLIPAAAVLRTTRPARPAILPLWSLSDRIRPLTAAPAAFGPTPRGAHPPIQPHPSIPAQKIPLSTPSSGVQLPGVLLSHWRRAVLPPTRSRPAGLEVQYLPRLHWVFPTCPTAPRRAGRRAGIRFPAAFPTTTGPASPPSPPAPCPGPGMPPL